MRVQAQSWNDLQQCVIQLSFIPVCYPMPKSTVEKSQTNARVLSNGKSGVCYHMSPSTTRHSPALKRQHKKVIHILRCHLTVIILLHRWFSSRGNTIMIITVIIMIINVTPSLLPFPCPFSPMVTEGISLGIIISSLDLQQQQKVKIWQKRKNKSWLFNSSGTEPSARLRLIKAWDRAGNRSWFMHVWRWRWGEGWLTYV